MSKFSCICPSEQKKRDIADKFPCICPSEQKKRDIADKFPCICPSEQKKKDIAGKFPCICPSEQKKRDIADKFPCICPTSKRRGDIANKFLYICPEREKKKIQSADFHTYANIQKAMSIKNPATAGGEIFLWRIYKRNRFRELFLVGTDSTPTPFVKIQQPLLF